MNSTPSRGPTWGLQPFAWGAALALIGIKLLLHGLTAHNYGYFRDELYFLDCARHMGWGFVDDAPLTIACFKAALWMGGSLPAVRMIAAAWGAGMIAISMLLARELGGGRFAQGLAGLCVLCAPILLAADSILCVTTLETVLWTWFAFHLARFLRTGDPRQWLWAGLAAGVGLENKYSTLVVLLALLIALLLSPQRRELIRPWLWAGAGLALLVFLPTLLWQAHHHFPVIEDQENVRRMGKNVVLAPWPFLKQQITFLHPFLFPVWLAGLVSLLRRGETRLLGWLYLAVLGVMMALHAKDYYVASIYPMLFAAGGVAFERFFDGPGLRLGRLWPKAAVCAVIILVTAPLVPAILPFLAPEKLAAYQVELGLKPKQLETHHEGALDQRLGDQIGWPEMAQEVARVYQALPPEERAKTAIYAANYGEAGAINQFGPALGLPEALCAHQAHSLWGTPAFDGDTIIALGCSRKGLEEEFRSVELAAEHHSDWGMGEENGPIYLCRGVKTPLKELWPSLKHWD
ncbi:MAG TPA: glycosyltransferase family 39 protein [Holophagaceae bacterium]|nr:glycosyltransferase family 39 protein [Holophagaceae bacterium]